MHLFDDFLREHQRIEGLARVLERLTRLPERPHAGDFLALRTSFANLVMGHLKREERVVYALLRTGLRREQEPVPAKTWRELGDFSSTFAEYGRRWTRLSIAADWRAYCAETRFIIGRLRERAAVEEATLYPLVELAHMARARQLMRPAV